MSRTHAPIALSLLCILCACKTTSTEPAGEGDGVAAIQFADAVVPDGLNLHDRYPESNSVEASGWRYGHFVYTGQTHLQEACSHILARMPQHGWTLASDEQPDESTRKLKFTRGRYATDYTLRRQDGITEMVIDYRTTTQSR